MKPERKKLISHEWSICVHDHYLNFINLWFERKQLPIITMVPNHYSLHVKCRYLTCVHDLSSYMHDVDSTEFISHAQSMTEF